jgi:hypothetical protein
MSALDAIAEKIITEQELVIGPLAWTEARKVQGLQIDASRHVTLSAQPMETVDRLVAQYERLFGKASEEVCRQAVKNLLASLQPTEIPLSLRA